MLLQVKIPGQSIFLRAPDEATRRHWVDVMQLAVEMSKAAASEVKAPPGPVDSDDSEYDS